MKMFIPILLTFSLAPASFTQEVSHGVIIIMGETHTIRFINVENESYISWSDLQETLPMLFSLTKDGEILVNPLVLAPLTLNQPPSSGVPSGDVIESRIDGTFEGWDGDTIFKLINGQIWQQAEYAYTYHYAYRPEVLIYRSGSGYKMKVEGVSREIRVKRLR